MTTTPQTTDDLAGSFIEPLDRFAGHSLYLAAVGSACRVFKENGREAAVNKVAELVETFEDVLLNQAVNNPLGL